MNDLALIIPEQLPGALTTAEIDALANGETRARARPAGPQPDRGAHPLCPLMRRRAKPGRETSAIAWPMPTNFEQDAENAIWRTGKRFWLRSRPTEWQTGKSSWLTQRRTGSDQGARSSGMPTTAPTMRRTGKSGWPTWWLIGLPAARPRSRPNELAFPPAAGTARLHGTISQTYAAYLSSLADSGRKPPPSAAGPPPSATTTRWPATSHRPAARP